MENPVKCYALQVDKEVCHRCGTCERLLHGFISRYQGMVFISAEQLKQECVSESVRALKDACPEQAISLSMIH